MAEMQETNNIDISSEDESSGDEDDIYDKFTDEDFKSEKNIKELSEYVEKYNDYHIKIIKEHLETIHQYLYLKNRVLEGGECIFVSMKLKPLMV